MSFFRNLFSRRRETSTSGSGLIEVQNKWGTSPLLVEPHPDLERIFSDPNPQPPARITEMDASFWKSLNTDSIRVYLAMAYLSHPDHHIRAATIPYIESYNVLSIANALADLLADPSSKVSSAAARAIWKKADNPDPDTNSVAFTIRILRDEILQRGFISHMRPEEAVEALMLLRAAQPNRRDDFNRWLMYGWCRSDEELSERGNRLFDIFYKYGTFLGLAEPETRQVGNGIGDLNAMRQVYEAIQITLGNAVARELEVAWNGIGRWRS